MECDAMDLSFESSVPETMEESIPDDSDSEPSTPKSVASPAFSLISSPVSMQHSSCSVNGQQRRRAS